MNRVSGPDANSCAGCHNLPNFVPGGGGDFVTSTYVGAERFDFVTFDRAEPPTQSGSKDEAGRVTTLQTIGNLRSTPGLYGAGYLELLARQMTADLRRTRDAIPPGQSRALVSKGVSFGTLGRRADGTWDTTLVEGLPRPSVRVSAAGGKPSLTIRPWQQSGTTSSLREMVIASFNRHHGIQATERFGAGRDADGDGVVNELTRADVTAVTVFIATLPLPGRMIPNDPKIEWAVLDGERLFAGIGCTSCHVASLPLEGPNWRYTEPSGAAAASLSGAPAASRSATGPASGIADLTSHELPQPRLPRPESGTAMLVPAYTDFKLHDITDPADEGAAEPLDINEAPGSTRFRAGNRRFLTRRLWGVASEPPFFHHGLFTTMREAVLAHAGEAMAQRQAFEALGRDGQNAVIEFLKSLRVLPPGTMALVVDEQFKPKAWPPAAPTGDGPANGRSPAGAATPARRSQP